jgi:hypothetical protein
MYEFKPKPKVVPQQKAVTPTSKVKPDPELEKATSENTVQSDIQTPEKTEGVNSAANSDTTDTATGIQDDTAAQGQNAGSEGDAFQRLIAKDPITQLLDNDPITKLLDNDPFFLLINKTTPPKKTAVEGEKEATKATTTEEAIEGDPTKAIAIKDTVASQNKSEQKIATSSPEAAIGSVTKMPPLQLLDSMKSATTIATQAQQNQLTMAQEGMEEITIPTGIDAASEVKQPKVKALRKGKTPTIKTPSTAKKVTANKETKKLDKAAKKAPIKEVSTKRGAFINTIQQSRQNLGNVQTAAQSDLGAQPTASLDTASSPAQIQTNSIQAQQSIGNELGNAQQATTQDFGESGMFPKKAHKKAKIKIKTELTEQRESLLSENTEMPSFDEAETANINKELQARYQSKIDAAQQDMQLAGTDKDKNINTEKSKNQQDMMIATEEAKATQREERGKGQQEVINQKRSWQAENQKIKKDASMQLTKEQTKNEASITKKQAEGNRQITDTYAKADSAIEAKTKKADQDVAKQEKEGVEKEEKGWLDSAIDWVSDQFDKIKKAVNFIFDKLRAAVKSLVNWAKEKASSIINAVRDFAIKAVKAFGEIVKSVVSAALFMFPEVAAKFNEFIDKKIAQTIEVINKVAAALEKTIHALLDVIGKVIDTILVIYQKAINLALDVLETITVGILKILKFMANISEHYKTFQKVIDGIKEVWDNPEILENYVISFLQPFIDKIPGEANSQLKKYFGQQGASFAKHSTGVWRHLQPILAHMAANWWTEIKNMAWYLIWPFAEGSPLYDEAPKLWNLIPQIWNDAWDGNYSKVVDGGLEWWRALNATLGTFYGWIAIGSVLIGAIIGAFFGGAGAIPGALLGLELAYAIGEGILISTIAGEASIILKAIFDLYVTDDDYVDGEATLQKQAEQIASGTEEEGTEGSTMPTQYVSGDIETGHDRIEYAYQRIANSGFMLAIMAVFMLLGALGSNIAKALKPRIRLARMKFKKTKAGKLYTKKKQQLSNSKVGQGYAKAKNKINEYGHKSTDVRERFKKEEAPKKQEFNPEQHAEFIDTPENIRLNEPQNMVSEIVLNDKIKSLLTKKELLNFENYLRNADIRVIDIITYGEVDLQIIAKAFKDNPKAFADAVTSFENFAGDRGWYNFWKNQPNKKTSIKDIETMQKENLLLPTGEATIDDLATINAFTVDGGFINTPMRFRPDWIGKMHTEELLQLRSSLNKLFKVKERAVVDQDVFSGRTFSKSEFENVLMNGKGTEVTFKGMVSSSFDENIAREFIKLSSKNVESNVGTVGIIRKIRTKEGVYIDDLSDWGKNMGPKKHADSPEVMIQEEVVMNEGYFLQTSEPKAIIENGIHLEVNGVKYYEIFYKELVKPLK